MPTSGKLRSTIGAFVIGIAAATVASLLMFRTADQRSTASVPPEETGGALMNSVVAIDSRSERSEPIPADADFEGGKTESVEPRDPLAQVVPTTPTGTLRGRPAGTEPQLQVVPLPPASSVSIPTGAIDPNLQVSPSIPTIGESELTGAADPGAPSVPQEPLRAPVRISPDPAAPTLPTQ